MQETTQLVKKDVKTVQTLPRLKPKQAKFLRLYLATGNATQSAIGAGYSAKTAQQGSSRMLSNRVIRSHLTRLQDEAEDEHRDIFSSVIKRTNEITLKAERGQPVYNAKGEPVLVKGEPVYREDQANALKGLEQLSKLGNLYDKTKGPGEQRPAFVGISINMGDKPSVKILRAGSFDSLKKADESEGGPPENAIDG